MKVAIILILFILFSIVSYLYFRRRAEIFSKKLSEYSEWMRDNLDLMFYRLSAKAIRRLVLIVMLAGAIIGFFLPGKFSELDKLYSVNRAMDLNKKGDYEEVVVILSELRHLESPLLHNELGTAHLGMLNYDQAQKEFEKAIGILPQYSNAHLNLAVTYSRLGKNMDAAFELSRARESSKYTISDEELYRLSGSIWDRMFLRLLLAGLMAYGGYRLPWAVINLLRRRRIKKFDDQLPDGLMMTSNGLRAGFSMLQAFDIVSKETRPPLSQEFELLLKEHRLGYELDEALRMLSERIPTVDTKIFVNSVLILRETGGNLTEIFDTIAQTIQERKRVQKKIKTMTAEGETQAVILAILPIVVGFILAKLTPEVYNLMFTTLLGWVLIILMALMEVAGLYWMLKIARVKV